MTMEITRGFLGPEGEQIYYEVAGTGEPLLLIHAGVADSRMWDEQFAFFARYFRVIRYDIRGFGKSQFPPHTFAHHKDAYELLQSLQVEQAAVIGISFGGRIALDLALAYPTAVKSLVLVAPSVSGRKPTKEVIEFNNQEEALLERGDLAAAAELNVLMWVDGPFRTPEQVNPTVRERIREMQYHAFTIPVPEGADEEILTLPAIDRLSEVQIPALVIVGDVDLSDKLALSHQLAHDIKDAQEVIIPGAAHMVSMEQPALFNEAVMTFLQAHS